ncbi:hypothetical protein E6W39_12630 [Kitasatospora acidiphila]|uniref:PknH-like extracellular domain-containing protein n=1 Tax=Kitasatospora acidiphila TaxID=2567942 RepID=A0A540W1P7_9ACTN|nr:hypothetical protein [Kitasatospora acidiphila]TQF02949.1 hypothetical protein E6W39_12630 [Kitasatospora acidiphila]
MAAVAPLALALTACGPDDTSSSGSASGSTTPAATSAASQAPTGAAPATSGASGASGAGKTGKALTQDQLVKALLTVQDMGADANRSTLGPAGKQHKSTADKPACQPLVDLTDAANASPAPTGAATGFYYATNGREYQEIQLAQYAPGQAEKAMAAAESALAGCASFKTTTPGAPVPKAAVKFSKATYQALGDATVALQAEYDQDGSDHSVMETKAYVFIRTGDTVTMMADSALADPGLPDQALVKKQLDKLHTAQQG